MNTEEEFFQIFLNQEEANFIKKILPPQYFLNSVSKTGKNKYLISSEAILNQNKKNNENKSSQNVGPYKKCQKILNALKQHRSAEPFSEPVDPISLGIPTYFDVIKNPMDLSSVETKFRGNRYKSPYQFFQDIELIWNNAFLFNLPETDVYQMCQDIEKEYQILKKREFGDKLEREQKLKDYVQKLKKLIKPQEKEEEIKYLEAHEFTELGQNIQKLPNQYLYGVVEIISLYHPEYNFNLSQEIILESLSDTAVYKLFKYVNRCIRISNTWHEDYRDSAYIVISGLPLNFKEKDIIKIFSQFGEVVDINLIKDKVNGKFKGLCFLCYEDQRSTDLAVDNFNGIQLENNLIKVDHIKEYKIYDEKWEPYGPDGRGWEENRKFNKEEVSFIEKQKQAILNKFFAQQDKKKEQIKINEDFYEEKILTNEQKKSKKLQEKLEDIKKRYKKIKKQSKNLEKQLQFILSLQFKE